MYSKTTSKSGKTTKKRTTSRKIGISKLGSPKTVRPLSPKATATGSFGRGVSSAFTKTGFVGVPPLGNGRATVHTQSSSLKTRTKASSKKRGDSTRRRGSLTPKPVLKNDVLKDEVILNDFIKRVETGQMTKDDKKMISEVLARVGYGKSSSSVNNNNKTKEPFVFSVQCPNCRHEFTASSEEQKDQDFSSAPPTPVCVSPVPSLHAIPTFSLNNGSSQAQATTTLSSIGGSRVNSATTTPIKTSKSINIIGSEDATAKLAQTLNIRPVVSSAIANVVSALSNSTVLSRGNIGTLTLSGGDSNDSNNGTHNEVSVTAAVVSENDDKKDQQENVTDKNCEENGNQEEKTITETTLIPSKTIQCRPRRRSQSFDQEPISITETSPRVSAALKSANIESSTINSGITNDNSSSGGPPRRTRSSNDLMQLSPHSERMSPSNKNTNSGNEIVVEDDGVVSFSDSSIADELIIQDMSNMTVSRMLGSNPPEVLSYPPTPNSGQPFPPPQLPYSKTNVLPSQNNPSVNHSTVFNPQNQQNQPLQQQHQQFSGQQHTPQQPSKQFNLSVITTNGNGANTYQTAYSPMHHQQQQQYHHSHPQQPHLQYGQQPQQPQGTGNSPQQQFHRIQPLQQQPPHHIVNSQQLNQPSLHQYGHVGYDPQQQQQQHLHQHHQQYVVGYESSTIQPQPSIHHQYSIQGQPSYIMSNNANNANNSGNNNGTSTPINGPINASNGNTNNANNNNTTTTPRGLQHTSSFRLHHSQSPAMRQRRGSGLINQQQTNRQGASSGTSQHNAIPIINDTNTTNNNGNNNNNQTAANDIEASEVIKNKATNSNNSNNINNKTSNNASSGGKNGLSVITSSIQQQNHNISSPSHQQQQQQQHQNQHCMHPNINPLSIPNPSMVIPNQILVPTPTNANSINNSKAGNANGNATAANNNNTTSNNGENNVNHEEPVVDNQNIEMVSGPSPPPPNATNNSAPNNPNYPPTAVGNSYSLYGTPVGSMLFAQHQQQQQQYPDYISPSLHPVQHVGQIPPVILHSQNHSDSQYQYPGPGGGHYYPVHPNGDGGPTPPPPMYENHQFNHHSNTHGPPPPRRVMWAHMTGSDNRERDYYRERDHHHSRSRRSRNTSRSSRSLSSSTEPKQRQRHRRHDRDRDRAVKKRHHHRVYRQDYDAYYYQERNSNDDHRRHSYSSYSDRHSPPPQPSPPTSSVISLSHAELAQLRNVSPELVKRRGDRLFDTPITPRSSRRWIFADDAADVGVSLSARGSNFGSSSAFDFDDKSASILEELSSVVRPETDDDEIRAIQNPSHSPISQNDKIRQNSQQQQQQPTITTTGESRPTSNESHHRSRNNGSKESIYKHHHQQSQSRNNNNNSSTTPTGTNNNGNDVSSYKIQTGRPECFAPNEKMFNSLEMYTNEDNDINNTSSVNLSRQERRPDSQISHVSSRSRLHPDVPLLPFSSNTSILSVRKRRNNNKSIRHVSSSNQNDENQSNSKYVHVEKIRMKSTISDESTSVLSPNPDKCCSLEQLQSPRSAFSVNTSRSLIRQLSR
eukprot:TRINITY_DN483_c7_g1_i1.p1 TRINITY_DN483_c7_g1~~TRINITY_DN483_c7_g1_i1.p1  ORF type:complete len:1540 (-),score=527.72 TRINITY_DN483_c7_g1_i1:313-4932(-)